MKSGILTLFILTIALALPASAAETLIGGNLYNGNQEGGAYTVGSQPSASQSSMVVDHTIGVGSSMEVDLSAPNSFSQWKAITISSSPPTPAVNVGDSITVSGWVYVPSATTFAGIATFNLPIRDEDSQVITLGQASIDLTTATRDTWIQDSATFTVPSGVTELRFVHWNVETVTDPSAYSGVFYIDDISVVNNTTPNPPPPTLPIHGLTLDPAAQDLDSNGLPDIWEAIYGAQGISPTADSDGDGVNNLKESIAGTDPFDPDSRLVSTVKNDGAGAALVSWSVLQDRPGELQSTNDLKNANSWTPEGSSPSQVGDEWQLTLPIDPSSTFFRVAGTSNDLDLDGVPDWLEPFFQFSGGAGNVNSSFLPVSYDTTGDNIPDTTLSGDLSAFNEIYRQSETGTQLTRAQAARFLLQASFGAKDMAEVDHVAGIGAEAWIDEQVALPITYHQPYIDAIKADWLAGGTDPNLAGYAQNATIVFGLNQTTSWGRAAIQGDDQLRQRVAFALSQIVVASRGGAMLANQGRAMTHYYDMILDESFGNYEDLLLKVSISPVMGTYLSSLGNRKKDAGIGRFPDENYAREIMQLFSIGLWELNADGTQKLDGFDQPIPTYDNVDITELARIFTGTNYASATNPNTVFGNGWRDDGDNSNQWMLTPMKAYESEHDWDNPRPYIVTGDGSTFTLPVRSNTNANAMLNVEDVVNQLVHHPNCAPFISRQLIQFLVTSNPTPAYVGRVSAIFTDNGSGVTGDLEAVVRAILLDDEARNPLQHLTTGHFGLLREPTIRTMHLARIIRMGDHPYLRWWDWGQYMDDSLQDPQNAPTVFNYFRPDFQLFGTLSDNDFDSPVFQIVDSYSSISFPNRLWLIARDGFKDGNNTTQPENVADLEEFAGSVPNLLDHLSILYCGGTLSASSRATITTALESTTDLNERARLAAYLVLNSPEGSCQK